MSRNNTKTTTTPYSLQQDNDKKTTRKSSGSGSGSSDVEIPPWSSANPNSAISRVSNLSTNSKGLDVELQYDHPEYYMTASLRDRLQNDFTMSEHDKMIIQRLACRKFHIPGQSFWEDYKYWFCNNHPFICFCMADPRHPLGKRERIINLVSSLAFGLAATCLVVLWFFYEGDKRDFNNVAFTLPLFGFNVTVGALALLLFSGPLHVAFDLSIFFVQACPPCRTGGIFEQKGCCQAHQTCWLWIGAHVAFLISIAAAALAINVMFLRASVNEGDGDDQNFAKNAKDYTFLLLYLLEVFVANFVVFPIGTFTMFSGVLGCCGRIPGLGGRPYQVRKHQRMMEQQRNKKKKNKRGAGQALV